jgi:hypothetical protein
MQRCNGFKSGGKEQCTISGDPGDGMYFYCHHHKDQKENIRFSAFPFVYHGHCCETLAKKVFIRIFHGEFFYSCVFILQTFETEN